VSNWDRFSQQGGGVGRSSCACGAPLFLVLILDIMASPEAYSHALTADSAVAHSVAVTDTPSTGQRKSVADMDLGELGDLRISPFDVSTKFDDGYRASNSVTGSRFDSPIRELPLAIQAFTRTFIRDRKPVNIFDVARYSPGVTISSQQRMLILMIIIAVLGMGLSVTIYRVYRQRKMANARLTKESEDRERVEEALGRSEDLYNKAPCGYHSLDENGVFVRMNDTELEWLGYTREEVVGKMRFADLITESGRRTYEESFPRVKAGEAVHNMVFELVRKDGATHCRRTSPVRPRPHCGVCHP
jgi:PAS domain S-box-containing protein